MQDKTQFSPIYESVQSQGEVNHFQAQKIRFFEYLKENVATASMVADATGIPQKCITYYKRDYEKAGKLKQIERKYCKKTGFKAWYLTTNPDLVNNTNNQLKALSLCL